MNLAILWRLRLGAWALCLGSWRLGASSLEPSILIRGPCLAQLLLMIFNSRAIVASWGDDAWLTSIVNFFIRRPVLIPPDAFPFLFLQRYALDPHRWDHSLGSHGFLSSTNFFSLVFFLNLQALLHNKPKRSEVLHWHVFDLLSQGGSGSLHLFY